MTTGAAPQPLQPAPTAVPRGISSLRPLRHRNYALLWSGGLVSIIGSWMQTVAVGALVAANTGSALWVALVAAGGFLPLGVLGPFAGVMADRLPRRAVLVIANLAAGAVALVIAALVAAREDGPGVLTLLVTAQGCVSAIMSPFQQAILPDLVPRSEFLAAASLNSAQFNLGRVVGPAAAGATIVAFGYSMAFVANAVSFLAVVVALAFVHVSLPSGRDVASVRRSLLAGWRAARSDPGCSAAISVIALVGLLASPFIALVPAVAHHLVSLAHRPDERRAVASATAVLTTAQGVGAVVGALLAAPLAGRFRRGRVLLAAVSALPAVLVAYYLAPSLPLATVALFAVGLVYIGVLSGLQTVVQLRAPSQYRGRILSIYLVALGVTYPIGSLAEGLLADTFGLRPTAVAGVVVLAVLLVILRLAVPRVFSSLALEVS